MLVMCMPRKRACFLGYACAPRFHTEFWKQWQPRLPFFKNRAHAYQFCIPIPHMPPARLPKTGRMPTNFASRCRAYRPHGFQKQGACLPILHPDSAHAARTVTKNRAHAYQFCIPMPGIPSARFSKTGRMPTNFASRFRTCRPHGVQKQGAYPARTHLEQSTARFQGAWCSNARRRWVRAWRWSVPRR